MYWKLSDLKCNPLLIDCPVFICVCALTFTPRQVLDRRYGLKRWQIGEVASKIGQLYYHY